MAEKKMRTLSELRQLDNMMLMTPDEFAFFQRMTQNRKAGKSMGFLGMFVKGSKDMVLSAAEKFQRGAVERDVKDRHDRLKEIAVEKLDLKKLLDDGDIKQSEYNYSLAELELEEESISEL